MKKKLICKIVDRNYETFSSPNLTYEVYDEDKIVASGISSSEGWVRNDAGGYHTKKKFDELYPEGWEVVFDF